MSILCIIILAISTVCFVVKKMLDFRKIYKQVGIGQKNVLNNQRAQRRQRLNDQRRSRRNDLFGTNRGNLQGSLKKQEDKKVDGEGVNRLQTIAKWREERNRRKLLEKLGSKPPFKVGIVHHRWYSPPITKYGNTKNKQKRENMRNKKKKVVKVIPLTPMDYQFNVPIGINAISSPFDRRVDKKRTLLQSYRQYVFNDSVIKFLPEEFETSTPTQTAIDSIDRVISREQEEEELITQCFKYLLNRESERLTGLCDSLEFKKNERLTKGDDIYHLIEDCQAHFKKFEGNNSFIKKTY